jgi:hypothetical protein
MHHGREGQHSNRPQKRRAVSEGKGSIESTASPAGRRRAPNIPFPPRELSLACRAGLPSPTPPAAASRVSDPARAATGRATRAPGRSHRTAGRCGWAPRPGGQPDWAGLRRCSRAKGQGAGPTSSSSSLDGACHWRRARANRPWRKRGSSARRKATARAAPLVFRIWCAGGGIFSE